MSDKRKKQVAPGGALTALSPFRVEIHALPDGRKSILIAACGTLVTYDRNTVRFRRGRETLTLEGADLWCRAYQAHTAEVVGRVRSILFEGREHRD